MKHLLLIAILLSAFVVMAGGCESLHIKALRAQTVCPVEGTPINKAIYYDCEEKGVRIYACNEDSCKEIAKNPEKYIKILEQKNQIPETILEDPKNLLTDCPGR